MNRILASSALFLFAASAQATDILACATEDRIAVAPADALQCEWKGGEMQTTLTALYEQDWRLVETAFFKEDRQVLYLERETAPATPEESGTP